MRLYSTNKQAATVSIDEAILRGLAPDGGLYMPERIPALPESFISNLSDFTLSDIAFEVAKLFLLKAIPSSTLEELCSDAINFEAPLVPLNDSLSVLELFHGPTFAFKDFGARFMARVMAYFRRDADSPLTILVATSGDTGGAVANGFYQVPGIRVVLLYPQGKVSPLQEQQLTTLGENIDALEVKGTFDDCQRMVKEAFTDLELQGRFNLTSANSINIARLIPQSFYYLSAAAELQRRFGKDVKISFSVPSGNFGNITAGLLTKRYGLSSEKFIAATNRNDTFVNYLQDGNYQAKASVPTISNAMDVGDPSNFARLMELYQGNIAEVRKEILGASFSDEATREMIRSCFERFNYSICPHGAVGLLGVEEYKKQFPNSTQHVVLGTAHPAKFLEIMDSVIPGETKIPARLESILSAKKSAVEVSNSFADLKNYLLSD